MATQYMITTNGVDYGTRYTSKARAISEAATIAVVADKRGEGDVVEVQTVKTSKVVFSHTATLTTAETRYELVTSVMPCEWTHSYGPNSPSVGCGSGAYAVHRMLQSYPVAAAGTALCGHHSPFNVTDEQRAFLTAMGTPERTTWAYRQNGSVWGPYDETYTRRLVATLAGLGTHVELIKDDHMRADYATEGTWTTHRLTVVEEYNAPADICPNCGGEESDPTDHGAACKLCGSDGHAACQCTTVRAGLNNDVEMTMDALFPDRILPLPGTDADVEAHIIGSGALGYSWWDVVTMPVLESNGYDAVDGWSMTLRYMIDEMQDIWSDVVTLTPDMLRTAIRTLGSLSLDSDVRVSVDAEQECGEWLRNGPDDVDFDAASADHVLQFALMGSVQFG
jgi:hypothetical protein